MKLRGVSNVISKLLLCGGGLVLTNFLLLGAGYASWDITPKVYASLTGEADDAVKVDDFFAIKEITTFTSSPYGIYDQSDASSETIIREGVISVKFTFTYKYQQLLDLGYLSSTVTDDATTYSFSFLTCLGTQEPEYSGLLSCISGASISGGSASISLSTDTTCLCTDTGNTAPLTHKAVLPISSSTSDETTVVDMTLTYTIKDYPTTDTAGSSVDGSSTSRGYLYSQYGEASLTFALEAQKAS